MRGRFLDAWQAARSKVWRPLAKSAEAPDDLFCELYRELVPALTGHDEVTDAALFSDPDLARSRFMRISQSRLVGERELRNFFVRAHAALSEIDDQLAMNYAELLTTFCVDMNLRYKALEPFQLVVTLPGMFAELNRQLRATCETDPNLADRLGEFEESFADLTRDHSPNRIKICVQKQVNLLEALAGHTLGQQGQTLGVACGNLQSWPHATLREGAKKLYGFANDYPGIRHAGNANGVLKEIDLRDLISVATLLLGYAPYMTETMDPSDVFHGLAA